MRTLKKSLCLVLALVMVLGLCMIGANATYAEYTDKKEINYTDAVEVLTGLGVIEGYPDGEFKPVDNVTRAEAAAMITRMMLGRDKADKLPIGDVKFNDVPETNWAAKYISFCANKGIIVGVGNGNFEPSRNVTGTELAVMLLRALGYGTMGEYEGKGWDINGVADALYYKVFEDSEVTDFSQPATREETALYVFNTLWVELVGYDVDLNYYRGKGTDFAGDVYSLAKIERLQVEANQATGEKYTVISGRNYDIETGLDLIAHEVTLYYKTDSRDKDKENNTFWKAFLVQDTSTILDKGAYYGDTYKALIAANKNNKYASLNFDGWINYVYSDEADTVAIDTGYDTAYDLQGRYTSSAMVSFYLTGEIILDSDGMPLAYMKTEYTVDQVKKISDEGIELKNDDYDFDVYDPEYAYDGIAKGDYVTVQPVGKICYLYPTTTQEINVTERNYLTDFIKLPYFNFYAVAPSAGYGAVNVPDTDDCTTIYSGDKVLFYMDYYGAFFAAKILERGTLEGIMFINCAYTKPGATDEYGESDTTVYVQCVDSEGNEAIYPLDTKTYKTEASATAKGRVVRVYTDSKGVATLSPVGGDLNKEASKSSYLTKDGGIYYVTSDTKIFYVNGVKKDMKVKASNKLAPDAYTAYAYWTGSSSYNLEFVWITGEEAPAGGGDSYLFLDGTTYGGWALNGGSMLINEETTYYFTAYIDGVKSNAAFINNADVSNLGGNIFAKEGFYTYTVDEFGVYDIEAVSGTSSTLKVAKITLEKGNVHNGKLYLTGTEYDSDAAPINNDIVVVNKPKTYDGKKYLTADTIEDIEGILEDGGTIDVTYLAVKSGDTWVPTGAIYVQGGKEAAPEE